MSNVYHTPIGYSAAATSLAINNALSDLDLALTDIRDGEFLYAERSVNPSTPAAGYWKLFFKNDGLYTIDDTGSAALAGDKDFTRVVAQTTLSVAATNITLSGIPSTYTHLLLELQARSDNASTDIDLRVAINSDSTAANYYSWGNYVSGAANSWSETLGSVAYWNLLRSVNGASSTAGYFGAIYLWFLDYKSTSQYKYSLTDQVSMSANTANNRFRSKFGGLWLNNTDAISSLVLTPSAGNFDAGTRYSLYGID